MWEISTREQLITIVFSLVYGFILCILYDLIRALRKAGADSFTAVFAGDLLFFAAAAVSVFFLCLARTCGEIRGYILFAAALGFLLFRISLSKITFYIFSVTFTMLAKVSAVISLFSAKTVNLAESGVTFLINITAAFLSYCKKLLKNAICLLYNKEKYRRAGENTDEC